MRIESDLRFNEQSAEGFTANLGPLFRKTILFTGTISVPRGTAQKWAEAAGAIPLGSVSKKLDYLVAGEKAGSKLDKALGLGVTVLDETEFRNLLRESGIEPE